MTTLAATSVLDQLKRTFNGSNIHVMNEMQGDKICFTAPEINTSQFNELSMIINENNFEVNIKRSGTGLSIHLK